MKYAFTTTARITIKASAERVWNALIDPKQIKEYLFGTEATSKWKVGSLITYRGVWKGKPYEDKGTILELKPSKLLKSTYWSGMSGLEDKPENYNTVTHTLRERDGHTTRTVTQDNNRSKDAAVHSESNWGIVLKGLKALMEK
jgi:uncharacterized protein YndB with AHSA1/START domain